MAAETWFLAAGIALAIVALWGLARHDWLRLTRPARHATGEVIGHRTSRDDGGLAYAAIIRFCDESGTHEVTDSVLHQRAAPPVGTLIALTYPEGRPDLARPPRPWLWLGVYAALSLMLTVLIAKALGLLPK